MVKQGINAAVICHYGYSCRRTRSCIPPSLTPPFSHPFPSLPPSPFLPFSLELWLTHRFALLRIICDRFLKKNENRKTDGRGREARRREQQSVDASRHVALTSVDTHGVCHSSATPSAIHHRECQGMNNGRINVVVPTELRRSSEPSLSTFCRCE